MEKENNKHSKTKMGAALVAGAAALAGAYFLYGTKQGTRQRKKLKGWMLKMKGEVLERLEKVKEINQETYEEAIDRVGDKYKQIKEIDEEDVEQAKRELKSHWRAIEKNIQAKISRKKKKE